MERRFAPPPGSARPARLTLAACGLASLLLAGCLGLSNDDPAIPEEPEAKEVPVYAYAADFSTISGVLFKPFRDEPYWGIAFSHEPSAPYGGYFVLGTTELLAKHRPGDRVTVTGRPTEERFAPWQSGTWYIAHRVDPTDTHAPDPAWPDEINTNF